VAVVVVAVSVGAGVVAVVVVDVLSAVAPVSAFLPQAATRARAAIAAILMNLVMMVNSG